MLTAPNYLCKGKKMAENVLCSKQKTTSDLYRRNFDKIKWNNKNKKKVKK